MKRLWSVALLICLGLPISAQADHYALLVGIDAYPAPNTLEGCVHDVQTMQQVLTEHYGVPSANIKTVLDAEATLEGIKTAFQRHLIQQAQPGDVALFYYSGHGTQVPDFSGDEADQIDESLCPVDIDAKDPETWLTDDTLGRWLAQMKTPQVAVILDACFSGTGTRAEGLRGKFMSLGFQRPPGKPIDVRLAGSQMQHVLIAGSAADQLSHILHPDDGKGSVLTHFLTDLLINAAADFTYELLMQALVPQVEEYVRRRTPDSPQTPQFEGAAQQPVLWTTSSHAATESGPPAPAPDAPQIDPVPAPYDDFRLSLKVNRSLFYDDDLMVVTVEAARDCYLRLYVMNAEQQIQQLFPNTWQAENFIRAGEVAQIPGPDAPFRLKMGPPFGSETLVAIASTVQFEDLGDLDWQAQSFLNFTGMGPADMRWRGVDVEAVPQGPKLSEATVIYEVRPRH